MLLYKDAQTGVKTYDKREAIRYYERGHDILVVDHRKSTGREEVLALWETPATTLKRKEIEKNFKKTLDKFLEVW